MSGLSNLVYIQVIYGKSNDSCSNTNRKELISSHLNPILIN